MLNTTYSKTCAQFRDAKSYYRAVFAEHAKDDGHAKTPACCAANTGHWQL
jgi:hypothetical protein